MDEYVWYVREVEWGTDQLKDLLLDGWEPIGGENGVAVTMRKLVSREDFELLWIQDRKSETDSFDPIKEIDELIGSFDPYAYTPPPQKQSWELDDLAPRKQRFWQNTKDDIPF